MTVFIILAANIMGRGQNFVYCIENNPSCVSIVIMYPLLHLTPPLIYLLFYGSFTSMVSGFLKNYFSISVSQRQTFNFQFFYLHIQYFYLKTTGFLREICSSSIKVK